MVWLIVLIMRAHGLGGRPWLALGIVAMLTVCTSLPWFSGQLIPDILFPAAVLALNGVDYWPQVGENTLALLKNHVPRAKLGNVLLFVMRVARRCRGTRFVFSESNRPNTGQHPRPRAGRTAAVQTASAAALRARSSRLRSVSSSSFLRRRIDFGVTSTSSSSSI
jgi:hypothetical protein